MIFRRGVCFMPASLSGVRGWASGSASAAAWICSSVFASARLQSCLVFIVIPPSLIGFSQPCRDDPNSLPPQGVRDKQQAIFHHADRHKAVLAFVLAAVRPFDSEDVLEHLARHLEADVVIAPVLGGFVVAPFKIVILHNILHSSSFVNCP